MNYEKLKKFDLLSIKSQEQADEWKNTVLESTEDDVLRYINFLRYQQFHGDITIKYMERIIQFLSYDEMMDIERANTELLSGDVEDLTINAPTELEEEIIKPIKIGGEVYSVKAELMDDFETVVIVSDGEKLVKFGFILDKDQFYAYELFEETQEFYEEVVKADINTKVNLYSDVVGENQVTKTFIKQELCEEYPECLLTKKTNKGVMSPLDQGSFTILKKETVLSADGVSEDRMASHMAKLQNEIAAKLGMKPQDFENMTNEEPEETKEKKYTKADFEDDFKFSQEYCFSIETPDEEELSFTYNSLTETILNFHGTNFDNFSDEYVEEVYQLLTVKFGVNEDSDGSWAVPNTKLERVLRTIVRAGGKVETNDENASMFLQRFIRDEKLETILKTSTNFQVVKKIRTKTDVEQFAKDSGTELYIQINQVLTAILEGASRLYGEGHIVFDSDHKLTICQIDDELDLVGASNYAIDNDYKRFYVIEKDKYTQYDAYYKETLKTKLDDKETEEDAPEVVAEPVVLTKYDVIEETERFSEPEKVIFETEEPQDIIILGSDFNDSMNFAITDDYSSFELLHNSELKEKNFNTMGYTSIIPLKDFYKNVHQLDDTCWDSDTDESKFKPSVFEQCDTDIKIVRNFVGKISLKIKKSNYDNDDSIYLEPNLFGEYIQHDFDYDDIGGYDEDIDYIQVVVDVQGTGTVQDFTDELYEELKLVVQRESKLKRVLDKEDEDTADRMVGLRIEDEVDEVDELIRKLKERNQY